MKINFITGCIIGLTIPRHCQALQGFGGTLTGDRNRGRNLERENCCWVDKSGGNLRCHVAVKRIK